jgi:hypothetical protein
MDFATEDASPFCRFKREITLYGFESNVNVNHVIFPR